jgi:hypothetical protein
MNHFFFILIVIIKLKLSFWHQYEKQNKKNILLKMLTIINFTENDKDT